MPLQSEKCRTFAGTKQKRTKLMTNELDLTQMGLSPAEVEQSRKEYGTNRLTPPKRPSAWKLYLEKFKDPIVQILIFAAVLSLGIGFFENEYLETIGILVAVFLATTIGFYFEYDAAKRFEVLNALEQEEPVTLVRGGHIVQLSRSELVVGDVVLLQQGEEVPADGLLLQTRNLEINESSLTGEPLTHKTINPAHFDAEATYPSNTVLRSSMVADGNGVMRITAVGDATEIGQVAREATKTTDVETPLRMQLDRLAKVITRITFVVSALIFVICTVHGLYTYFSMLVPGQGADWLKIVEMLLGYFMIAVTLIVMAVPEGLPMAISLSLALNMRRMLKTNNLVRKMHACETMGAVTVICTDKTGTLTQNRMAVTDMQFEAAAEKYVFENIATNSTAHIEENGDSAGNPTECALLQYLKSRGEDYMVWRKKAELVNQLPFSTDRKYMATIVRSSICDKTLLYVKGAPEIVARLCVMNEQDRAELSERLRGYQQKAMRTLAFAYRELEPEQTDCEALVDQGRLHFLGVVAIMDPVREEVPLSVAACRSAGIKVKMVTGDNAGTAIEIARRIGLWTDKDGMENTITGPEFEALSDGEAYNRVQKLKIMSRARPMDKQRLVQLLQKAGEVVAVTGDGTNDAPALNFAQVGLSMGSGTSVAKEASDITLIDDSFGSIATAVLWGRSLYKNIQRFVAFQLTISLAALLISIVGAIFGTEMPLTVTQILWINLIMDTFASLAISTIPPSGAVMKEKPRKQSSFIITHSMVTIILGTGLAFFAVLVGLLLKFHEWDINFVGHFAPKEMTVFFTLFVMMQFWNLLNVKTIGTGESAFRGLSHCKGLLGVLAVILIGQVLIVEMGGEMFRTVPLSWETWLILFAASSLVLWIGEAIRGVMRLIRR